MRVVFMGTPEFAVPSLRALLDAGIEVMAAVTQPDRPSGRGHKLMPCPAKALAVSRDVPVLQFERLRGQEGIDALTALAPDLFVTAAYGQILSQAVLDIPRIGTVNVHASLLPKYRGPAPIQWCLIEGETVTGVTTMMTDAGVDTGDMLLQRSLPILPDETAGALSVRLAELGAGLLIETLDLLNEGRCPRAPQNHEIATRHPMLKKERGRVAWSLPASRIVNLARGLNPWPCAWTTLPDGTVIKILAARALPGKGEPGRVLYADSRRGLAVGAGEGALEIQSLQAPGAKAMPAGDYLRGHPMEAGFLLGGEDIHE